MCAGKYSVTSFLQGLQSSIYMSEAMYWNVHLAIIALNTSDMIEDF